MELISFWKHRKSEVEHCFGLFTGILGYFSPCSMPVPVVKLAKSFRKNFLKLMDPLSFRG